MNQNHIIQKVFVEITLNKKEKAYGIKDDIRSFLSIAVFPEIEKYIDALERKFPNQITGTPVFENIISADDFPQIIRSAYQRKRYGTGLFISFWIFS